MNFKYLITVFLLGISFITYSQSTKLPAKQFQQSGATTGQVLKWNGSAWVPANDSLGIQTVDTFDLSSKTIRISLLNDSVPLSTVDLSPLTDRIGFGTVMYQDVTYSSTDRLVGSLSRKFTSITGAIDSVLSFASANGKRVELAPGAYTLSSYPSVNKNNKEINILGGPGTKLTVSGTYSYISPDSTSGGALDITADTLILSSSLTDAISTRFMPSQHKINLEANVIGNGSFGLSKSKYYNLKAKQWNPTSGTYLINPVYTQPKLGDTVTHVQALIDIDQIRLMATGTSPRALSYLNSQFDSCILNYNIGSIKKDESYIAGRGFSVHVWSHGSTDTTTVNNSRINTTIGSVDLGGTSSSDASFIAFRPGTPGGTDYPIYIRQSDINYTIGNAVTAEKLIEFSSRTEMTRSNITVNVNNFNVTNDNGIYFQRVTLDSTTIVFDGNFCSTAAGSPLIYLDSITFLNGSKIIFRGTYEHKVDGNPVVRILGCTDEVAGSIVFENATLITQDTPTVIGTAIITGTNLVSNRELQSTITLSGDMKIGTKYRISDVTTTPIKLMALGANNVMTDAILGTNLSFSGDTLNAAGGGGGGNGIYGDTGTVAPIPDFLARLRPDTTFAIGETTNNGFEDFWDTYAPGDYFQGLFMSETYWGSYVGMGYFNSDNEYKSFEVTDDGLLYGAFTNTNGIYNYVKSMPNLDLYNWRVSNRVNALDKNVLAVDTFNVVNIFHLSGLPATLSATTSAAAGTGASVALIGAQSSDVAGRFTVTSGTGASAGLWVTITFDDTYKTPPVVQFDCEDANCAALRWYSVSTETDVKLYIVSGQSDGTEYKFNYTVIQPE